MSHFKIRYRGRLRLPVEVEQLADEVEDVCRSNGWESHRWEEDWSKPNTIRMSFEEEALYTEGHAPLKGVSFNPGTDMETVWLTFTPDGTLNSLFTLQDPTFTAADKHYPWNRVKTKFGDAKTHAVICDLFRYVGDKYFAHIELEEEPGYWQHRDMARLEKFMAQIADDYRQLEEELVVIQNDDSIEPERKSEILYDLLRQFGTRNKPYESGEG